MLQASPSTNRGILRIHLLGSFRLERESRIIRLPARKAETLLAYLVLNPQAHPREKLATLLWGDVLDTQARHSLRTALATLRKTLGNDVLLTDRETVQLNPGLPLWVDALEFRVLAKQLLTAAPPEPTAINFEIYQGELLPDFYDEWLGSEREALRRLYLDALLHLAAHLRSQSEYGRVIAIARKVLITDPTNEIAHQHLMFCYAATGERVAALKQYEDCARVLRAELAAQPSSETTTLRDQIMQELTGAISSPAVFTNLPTPLTVFVGREKELSELRALMTTGRLLTLTGAGGCGKTRLAIQIGAELAIAKRFKHGVWWVEMASLKDPALVPQSVASVFGLRQSVNTPLITLLAHYLREKELLLMLDNCEHLIEACAQLADTLLSACPQLQVLATSREALSITGEVSWPVPSLAMPDPANLPALDQLAHYDAIQLFVQRARAVSPNWKLDGKAAIVAQICSQLDGIPLAIELAAARVKTLPVEKLAERLDDRFHLLTGGSRAAVPRQQTLRGTVDWSHSLLSEPERVLFRRLSVFAGGWALESAEAVCAGDDIEPSDVVDLLMRLVDKSLVVLDEQKTEARYRMLETIRQYAREKLFEADESDSLRDKQLDYFLKVAADAEPMLMRRQRTAWLTRLEAENYNLRVALEWGCQRNLEAARRLAGLLRWFWLFADHTLEAHGWYERVLALSEQGSVTRGLALALLGAGQVSSYLFLLDDAVRVLEQSALLFRVLDDKVRLAESFEGLVYAHMRYSQGEAACAVLETQEIDPLGGAVDRISIVQKFAEPLVLARSLTYWGRSIANARRDFVAARALHEESLAVGRKWEDPAALAATFQNLGHLAAQQEDFEAASRYHLESLAWRRQLGTRWQVGMALQNIGDIKYLQGDDVQAQRMFSEALVVFQAIGDRMYAAYPQAMLGRLAIHRGDLDQAAALLAESLEGFRTNAFPMPTVYCLLGYAELRRVQGAINRAVRIFAMSSSLPAVHRGATPISPILFERAVAAVRIQLSESEFNSAWEAGRKLTLEQALALAQEEP